MLEGLSRLIKTNISYFPRLFKISKAEFFVNNGETDLGWIWNILKPMLYIGMFYLAINLGFKSAKDIKGIVCPYIIWLASGIFPWFYLQKAIFGGAKCFKSNKALIYKANYPVTVMPMIPGVSGLLNHFFLVGILIVITLLSGVKPSITWLQIPFYTCMMFIFSYCWSFFTGLCTVISADFFNFIKSIRPAFFWLSGIFFNSRATDRANPIFFLFNPITYCVEGYRNCVCYNMWFWENMKALEAFMIVNIVLAILSFILYQRLKKSLPDII